MTDAKSPSTTSSEKKRKRAGPSYYVVKAGHVPGIYYSWQDVQEQINGFEKSIFKKFSSLTEAETFFKSETVYPPKSTKSSQRKFYGVQVGRVPGVYTDWPTAQQQINGWKGAKHKSFTSEEEAWAFVKMIKEATPGGGSTVASTAVSTKGDAESELSVTDARDGCKVGDNAVKKQKKNNGAATFTATNGDYELGMGPLPPDAEDGFDRTLMLNPETGLIERKTEAQLNARKLQSTGEFNGPLIVYTDGSSRGNGKKGAYAGIGVYFGPQDPRNVADPLSGERQTNQRAELTALQRAIDIAPIDRDVLIYSDSNYAIKCVTEWFPKWRQNGWKTSAGKKVDNQDIIEPIINRIEERVLAKAQTNFTWLKGHANDPGNEAADELANEGARKALEMRNAGIQL